VEDRPGPGLSASSSTATPCLPSPRTCCGCVAEGASCGPVCKGAEGLGKRRVLPSGGTDAGIQKKPLTPYRQVQVLLGGGLAGLLPWR
jgi:hypothetical protein